MKSKKKKTCREESIHSTPVLTPQGNGRVQLPEKEEARIRQWKERSEKNPLFRFADEYRGDNEIGLRDGLGESGLTNVQRAELQYATFSSATGSSSAEYSRLLFTQTLAGLFIYPKFTTADAANAITVALTNLKPKDEIEGMLISRLIVLHDQYMTFMARVTALDQTVERVDNSINRATKLMRLYNETLESLNRYRRKGEQKVIVQHVHVGEGGKAVVGGQINHGEGKMSNSEGVPHA